MDKWPTRGLPAEPELQISSNVNKDRWAQALVKNITAVTSAFKGAGDQRHAARRTYLSLAPESRTENYLEVIDEVLFQSSALSRLTRNARMAVARRAHVVQIQPGEALCVEGSQQDALLVVMSGEVEIVAGRMDGCVLSACDAPHSPPHPPGPSRSSPTPPPLRTPSCTSRSSASSASSGPQHSRSTSSHSSPALHTRRHTSPTRQNPHGRGPPPRGAGQLPGASGTTITTMAAESSFTSIFTTTSGYHAGMGSTSAATTNTLLGDIGPDGGFEGGEGGAGWLLRRGDSLGAVDMDWLSRLPPSCLAGLENGGPGPVGLTSRAVLATRAERASESGAPGGTGGGGGGGGDGGSKSAGMVAEAGMAQRPAGEVRGSSDPKGGGEGERGRHDVAAGGGGWGGAECCEELRHLLWPCTAVAVGRVECAAVGLLQLASVLSSELPWDADSLAESLEELPVFAALTWEQLRQLVRVLRLNVYPGGTVVYKQATVGNDLFIIRSGSVRLLKQVALDDNVRDRLNRISAELSAVRDQTTAAAAALHGSPSGGAFGSAVPPPLPRAATPRLQPAPGPGVPGSQPRQGGTATVRIQRSASPLSPRERSSSSISYKPSSQPHPWPALPSRGAPGPTTAPGGGPHLPPATTNPTSGTTNRILPDFARRARSHNEGMTITPTTAPGGGGDGSHHHHHQQYPQFNANEGARSRRHSIAAFHPPATGAPAPAVGAASPSSLSFSFPASRTGQSAPPSPPSQTHLPRQQPQHLHLSAPQVPHQLNLLTAGGGGNGGGNVNGPSSSRGLASAPSGGSGSVSVGRRPGPLPTASSSHGSLSYPHHLSTSPRNHSRSRRSSSHATADELLERFGVVPRALGEQPVVQFEEVVMPGVGISGFGLAAAAAAGGGGKGGGGGSGVVRHQGGGSLGSRPNSDLGYNSWDSDGGGGGGGGGGGAGPSVANVSIPGNVSQLGGGLPPVTDGSTPRGSGHHHQHTPASAAAAAAAAVMTAAGVGSSGSGSVRGGTGGGLSSSQTTSRSVSIAGVSIAGGGATTAPSSPAPHHLAPAPLPVWQARAPRQLGAGQDLVFVEMGTLTAGQCFGEVRSDGVAMRTSSAVCETRTELLAISRNELASRLGAEVFEYLWSQVPAEGPVASQDPVVEAGQCAHQLERSMKWTLFKKKLVADLLAQKQERRQAALRCR